MPDTRAQPSNLLIVDDDDTIQRLLVIAARDHGWKPCTAATGRQAIQELDDDIEAVVLDHGLPDIDGLQTLERLREVRPDLPVIMLTGLNDAETAVRAMKAGAVDYLTKPFELKRLFDLLRDLRQDRVAAPASSAGPNPPVGAYTTLRGPVTPLRSANPRVRELYRRMEKAASLDTTILLTGESGTGKTHFAREIHRLSPRAEEDFIPVSCPALPRELLESELFGHEKGSFTGATASRPGRFEQASKGTLFLDEIGDLPAELQPKLLNVLQDREYFRVGGSRILRTNARVIAATNVDLHARVLAGTFREDLYYRLNIIELAIPPLRERREDLPSLTDAILEKIAGRRGTATWTLSPEATAILATYDWPGNIRQLENVLERATAFTERPVLGEKDFLPLLDPRREAPGASPKVRTLHELERETFIEAYRRSGGNKARTARELGVSERTVYNLLERHGLK